MTGRAFIKLKNNDKETWIDSDHIVAAEPAVTDTGTQVFLDNGLSFYVDDTPRCVLDRVRQAWLQKNDHEKGLCP